MKKEQYKYSGAICGGCIPDSMFVKNPWAYMMAWTMPDKRYKKYAELKKSGQEKEATKYFEKYAHSHI